MSRRPMITARHLEDFTCSLCGDSGDGAAVSFLGEFVLCTACLLCLFGVAGIHVPRAAGAWAYLPRYRNTCAGTWLDPLLASGRVAIEA